MTQFEIIMRTDTPELPAEIGNFEEVKGAISEALKEYSTDAIVTADTVKDAEKTRAHLRKVKDQIETYRKDAKAAYLAKFNRLEAQCKELSGLIEKPITAIDGKIKDFENAENEKKWQALETFYMQLGAPAWIGIAEVVNNKWKNKTATLGKLQEEMKLNVEALQHEHKELQDIYGASPLWTAINQKFMTCKDKSQTLVYAAQLERQHAEEQKRAEAIQKAREEQERAQAAENAICAEEAPQAAMTPAQPENATQAATAAPAQMIRGTFRVTGTRDQIKALAAFLKNNGIQYEVIK